MFERFSSGYYLGKLYVEPHDCDRPTIHRADHERMNEQLYLTGDGVERLDAPLVMKLDTTHFPVLGDDDVPTGTLALPESMATDDLPDSCEVFLATADRASELLRYAGYEAPTGT
ncbi:DUF5802 family protein [Haloprofundus salilacus]|uniref:DUF5802 family protein n=1 Tax=Haloprofundus salilacus TaxID=2876190 RepID=UPI001CCE0A52|nr:DUF5802 family protein [Haloprofundus salilacus]